MSLNPRIEDWTGRTAWIIGASTGIGRATAELLHAQGAQVIASARSATTLAQLADTRPGIAAVPMDVTSRESVETAAAQVFASGAPDLVMYCAGHYRELRATQFDLAEMLRHNDVNYIGALRVLERCLPALLTRRSGHLSLVGSVAGYRGLPKSLAYGPTKAALINLAETLYSDLHPLGIGVSIVNPGFVETPLTAQNDFRMPALISPAQAAEAIADGWRRGDFEIHFPRRFTRWMKALQLFPYGAYFPAVRRFTGL
jgi:NAD(P)-dependent dehydrogenase (short-subunit alcohol dehydrogenase family)